jgi:uncharacterized membrane protein YkoI
MTRNRLTSKKSIVAIAAGVLALGAGGAAIAGATGTGPLADDSEKPINGPELEQASAAALAHTGEGAVSDTEVGDEESYYEVEVTLDDGSQVDVQLDRDFNVVGDEADGAEDEGAEDEKGGE